MRYAIVYAHAYFHAVAAAVIAAAIIYPPFPSYAATAIGGLVALPFAKWQFPHLKHWWHGGVAVVLASILLYWLRG